MGGKIKRVFVPFTEEEEEDLDLEDFEDDDVVATGRMVPDLINTPLETIRKCVKVAIRTIYGDEIKLKTKELTKLDDKTLRFTCERKVMVPGTTVCAIVAYDSEGYLHSEEMKAKHHLNRHDGLDITLNLPIPSLC